MKHLLLTTAALALAVTAPAAAGTYSKRTLSDAHVGTSNTELHAQMDHSAHVVAFFTTGPHRWMTFPRRSTCWTSPLGRRARRVCNTARLQLAAHRWLYGVAKERHDRLYVPRPAPTVSYDDIALPWPWSCIHAHEGSWTVVATHAGTTYYGGFQMDLSFQREFGGWALARYGTADRWPPSVQLAVAQRAPLSRWPTYAAYCT